MSDKLSKVGTQFAKAVTSLETVLQEEKTELVRDSAIKRFEYTFDLCWKLLKTFLEEKSGVICASPKGCFQDAYKQGTIEYDTFWLDLVDWRNKTSHTYLEALAEEVYAILPKALLHFKKVLEATRDL